MADIGIVCGGIDMSKRNVNNIPEFNSPDASEFLETLFMFRQYGDFLVNTTGVIRSVLSLVSGNISTFATPDRELLNAYSVTMNQIIRMNDIAKDKLVWLTNEAKQIMERYPDIPFIEFENNIDPYVESIRRVSDMVTLIHERLGTKDLNPDTLSKKIGEFCVI